MVLPPKTLPRKIKKESTDTEAILQVKNLVKEYSGRRVVNEVNFSIGRGEIVGLLGKNGAGKTTTFRMTIGMLQPDKGTVQFFNQDITNHPMYKRARLGMGYLSQETSVFRGLTVDENLEAILQVMPYSRREREKRKAELLEEFGLTKLVHNQAAVLSGGEKRRLEIARSLITNPRLLLLDEPFSGVDPIAVNEIQNIIYRLRDKGIGILVTDHNVRETLSTTKKSYIIYEGKILAFGSCEDILNNENARKYYLGDNFTM